MRACVLYSQSSVQSSSRAAGGTCGRTASQPASERSRSGDPLEAEEGGARKKTKHGAPTFFPPKMPAQRRACVHGPLWRPFFEPQATLLINEIAVARAHVPRPYR